MSVTFTQGQTAGRSGSVSETLAIRGLAVDKQGLVNDPVRNLVLGVPKLVATTAPITGSGTPLFRSRLGNALEFSRQFLRTMRSLLGNEAEISD